MFHVRQITPDDLPEAHRLTVNLYYYHSGLRYESLLTEAEFVDLFELGYLNGLVLTYAETQEHGTAKKAKPIGCMIYHSTVSNVRGKGIYLDQFIILEEFRRRGLGQTMMTRLCQICQENRDKFIQLIFRKGLPVEKLYTRLGFENCTMLPPRLHELQVIGKTELKKMIDKGATLEDTRLDSLVKLIIPFGASENCKSRTWTALNDANPECHCCQQNKLCHLRAQNIILAEKKLERSDVSKMCTFVEKTIVCSWGGPLVTFSDFVGDKSLLSPGVLCSRLRCWSTMHPNLGGAVWEVPCEVNNKDKQNACPLICSLKQLNVIDGTIHEGWNNCYLDEAGIRRMSELSIPENTTLFDKISFD
ncbi:hypothetical protein FBUS_08802 [Fasciolopsis buskii]|uniref:N-acetyltransferase domain-containing protein n=1 Tax=Fasciolopsis buskii TaxID=27845 RepID=A0A8E0RKX5_9TREM|nr:hypothetical protein FBUS_08802 [Fasciolopsis buski]